MNAGLPSRYSARPFPPYSYVPGAGLPHPVSDPAGHLHGHPPEQPQPLQADSWRESACYLYAVDLFNHGYYWEAHEAWESLWHAAGRTGNMGSFLKGLIKLAAAGVKAKEANPSGVQRHLARARELFESVGEPDVCGVPLARLLVQLRAIPDDEALTLLPAVKLVLAPLPP